jgi:erythromycin esterase
MRRLALSFGLGLAAVSLLGGCGDDAAGLPADAQAGMDATGDSPDAGLPTGMYPIAGLDPTLPIGDLAPVGAVVGNAAVVALGESVHTSGGYSAAKARLFRYLVEQKGYRVFAFETPRTAAEATGHYVATCSGTVRDALAGLFPVWANTATRDLLTWMCQYNQLHPTDPVWFYGFDIQQPWDDGAFLRNFFAQAAPADAAMLAMAIELCDGATAMSQDAYYMAHPNGPVDVTAPDNRACLFGLDAIDSYLATHEAALTAASSPDSVALAKMAARSLRAWQGEAYNYAGNPTASYAARDLGMADTFEALRALRFPTQKVVIWAHNYHISMHADEVTGDVPARSMGTNLKERLGDDYQPIGLVGYRVAINWPGVGCGDQPLPTAAQSVERMLHELGQAYLFVDLGFPGAAQPFLQPGGRYELGGAGITEVPARQFRALFYLDYSPAMQAIFWSVCRM